MKNIVIATILATLTTTAIAAPVKGTRDEMVQSQTNVARGVYIREDGARVEKPNETICNKYRNTYPEYTSKYGQDKGARIWVTIVTRRGC